MGYYTDFTLTASLCTVSADSYTTEDIPSDKLESLKEEVRKMNIFILEEPGSFEKGYYMGASWDAWKKDMSLLSGRFPEILFTLYGDGDDSTDKWVAYFLNGKCQVSYAEIVYGDFDPAKLCEERSKAGGSVGKYSYQPSQELPVFYGKSCNYAFAFNAEEDFDVFFITDEGDRTKDICELVSAHWNSVDTCILWAGYHLFTIADGEFKWERIVIQNENVEIEKEFNTQDKLVEAIWETLTDINIDEEECTEQDWFIFPAGTSRNDIWEWFDDHHSKGVGWLVNDYEGDKESETGR